MSTGTLDDRRRALEETFFDKQNQKLLEALKEKQARKADLKALAQASGISDEAVLGMLIERGIQAESLVALALVPLVAVAWADGKLQDDEREAVLRAASQAGLTEEGEGYALLQKWLEYAPGSKLFEAWREYVGSMCESLDPDQRDALRRDFSGRARSVADVAGGFLGLARISDAEQQMLEAIEAAF